MSNNQPSQTRMYYVGFCRICGTGPLGLRRCGGCGNILVLCDECDAVWSGADFSIAPLFAKRGDLGCPECKESLIGAPSTWANLREIEEADWLKEAIEQGKLELNQAAAFAPDARENKGPDH